MSWFKTQIGIHKENIERLFIDANGRLLLAVSDDVAYLWNINDRKIVASTPKSLKSVQTAAISINGKYVALVNDKFWLWNTEEPDRVEQFDLNGLHPYSVCFASNNTILAVGGNNAVKLIDIHQNQEISLPNNNIGTHKVVISSNGRWLASCSRWGTKVHFWDLNKLDKPYDVIEWHNNKGYIDLAFVGTKDQLATYYIEDKSLVIWDLEEKKQIRAIPSNYPNVAINPDGSLLVVHSELWMGILDHKGNIVKEISEDGYVYDLVFSPVSNTFYFARGIGLIAQWSYENSQDELANQIFKSQDWVNYTALYYRKLGFFQFLKDVPDHELSKRLHAMKVEDEGRPFKSSPTELELVVLLSFDRERIWWQDMECVYDDDVYTQAFTQWSTISRGSFQPENIIETWDWPNQRVVVSFESQGTTYTLYPEVHGDWFDISILDEINKIIFESGYQLVVFDEPRDQTAIVVCLTSEEKRKLGVDLGISFNR